MGLLLIGLGGLVMLVGAILMIVEGFKTSVVWGLLILFCGPAWLVFVIMNWDAAKRPLMISLLGFALYVGGIFMSGAKFGRMPTSGPTPATRNLE